MTVFSRRGFLAASAAAMSAANLPRINGRRLAGTFVSGAPSHRHTILLPLRRKHEGSPVSFDDLDVEMAFGSSALIARLS